DGKVKAEDLSRPKLAIKLARDLRLPVDEVTELYDLALTQDKVAFTLLPPGGAEKMASTLTGMTPLEAQWMKEAREFDSLVKEAGREIFV
ncbi:MAG TPA: hypothetical protein VF258_01370, partial [Luteolibacter sp.]